MGKYLTNQINQINLLIIKQKGIPSLLSRILFIETDKMKPVPQFLL